MSYIVWCLKFKLFLKFSMCMYWKVSCVRWQFLIQNSSLGKFNFLVTNKIYKYFVKTLLLICGWKHNSSERTTGIYRLAYPAEIHMVTSCAKVYRVPSHDLSTSILYSCLSVYPRGADPGGHDPSRNNV